MFHGAIDSASVYPREVVKKALRLGGVAVELKSDLLIERQARVIGATLLDQQLIGADHGPGDLGFGSDAKQAMQQRADFMLPSGRFAMLDNSSVSWELGRQRGPSVG